MPRKKRKPRFSKVEAVKAMARERIGTVPAAKVVPNKKEQPKQKHRKRVEELLDLAQEE